MNDLANTNAQYSFSKIFWIGFAAFNSQWSRLPRELKTCINELLQILIQARKVILPFLVVRDEALLGLQKTLPLLL